MTEISAPRRLTSTRARWAVPAVVAVAVAGAFIAPPLLASADDAGLPDVTPQQLVSSIAAAEPTPLSGTVVYTARLGLPEIPFGDVGGANPISLLGGSSTLRVWTDGTERSRVSLLGSASEYSVVRDGAEAWTYSSFDDAAVHYALSEADTARYDEMSAALRDGTAPGLTGDLPTPDDAARTALDQAGEFSTVSLDAQTTIAGRAAYQLIVSPKTSSTLVSRVVVGVDAETWTPLRVQVWSTQDETTPALEIGFTDISFSTPDDAVLAFSAPAGTAVKEVVVPLPEMSEMSELSETPESTTPEGELPEGVTVTGTGWETVVEVSGLDVAGLVAGDVSALGSVPGAEPMIGSESAQELLEEFMPSEGEGSQASTLDMGALYDQLMTEVPEGLLLSSTLLNVLVTDDGRVLVGSVPAETLRAMA